MLLRTFKIFSLVLLLYILLGFFYIHQTGDFRDGTVLRESPMIPLSHADVDVASILSQPYDYLNRGNQTYAFVSKDGKYVLKLFKKETLERSPIIHILPPVFPWRTFMLRSTQEEIIKRNRIFVGYKLAYEKDRDNTGLIYVNFDHVNVPPVTLIDGLGITRVFDLSTTPFVLQKKGKTTRQVLSEIQNPAELNRKIDQLYAMYISEYEKGIVDRDHNILDNTGFVDEQPIRLDVGKLEFDESVKDPAVYNKDLDKVKKRIDAWLKK